jgi:ribosomal protein S18 acetylase RimI-like enzyme
MVDTDTLPVRDLVVADLPQAVGLSAGVGWNQVEADWRIFLELGHPVAVDDAEGRLAATAATLPLGPGCAWISMVIVRPDHRRRGIATRLLVRCADEIESSGAVPGLDATPAGREVYLRLGFEDGWPLARWRRTGDAAPLAPADPPPGLRVRPLEDADMSTLAQLDRTAFGAERGSLLQRLRERSSGFAAVAEGEKGVCGFVLGRDGRTATHLGPLVATSGAAACALARHALESIAGGVTIDAADAASGLGRWLEASGFARERPFTRMYRGRPVSPGDPRLAMAMAGPELG